jgi:hypothetical protein
MPVTLLNESPSYDTAVWLLPEGQADPRALGYWAICLVKFDNDMAKFNDLLEIFYSIFCSPWFTIGVSHSLI